MPQAYSDPARKSDSHALPDVEYWYHDHSKAGDKDPCVTFTRETWQEGEDECECRGTGWYYWYAFPGCMPDSDPFGPFTTEAECVADFTEEPTCPNCGEVLDGLDADGSPCPDCAKSLSCHKCGFPEGEKS